MPRFRTAIDLVIDGQTSLDELRRVATRTGRSFAATFDPDCLESRPTHSRRVSVSAPVVVLERPALESQRAGKSRKTRPKPERSFRWSEFLKWDKKAVPLLLVLIVLLALIGEPTVRRWLTHSGGVVGTWEIYGENPFREEIIWTFYPDGTVQIEPDGTGFLLCRRRQTDPRSVRQRQPLQLRTNVRGCRWRAAHPADAVSRADVKFTRTDPPPRRVSLEELHERWDYLYLARDQVPGSFAPPLTEVHADSIEPPLPDSMPGLGPLAEISPTGMHFARISAGEFLMGVADDETVGDERARPQHEVALTRDYLLGVYEVTEEAWERVMGTNAAPESVTMRVLGQMRFLPTVRPLGSIVDFCNRLSELEGLEPFYERNNGRIVARGGPGYRLPSEAEWEYACRAGSSGLLPFDQDEFPQHAWLQFDGAGWVTLHPVGLRQPNPLGLYDMFGNASEMVWGTLTPYSSEGQIDPYAESILEEPENPAERPVTRGGRTESPVETVSSAARSPVRRAAGFRVARYVE